MKDFKQMMDAELASHYFNYIKHATNLVEQEKFFAEVDRRRGLMLRMEWLSYNY